MRVGGRPPGPQPPFPEHVMPTRDNSAKQNLLAVARRKLDESTSVLRMSGTPLRSPPRGGWIAAIREALGMSVQDFADRLGVTRAAAAKLETNEVRRTIQLDSLERAAHALNCDLVYALVPRGSLQDIVDTQRLQVFHALSGRTRHHMRLEAQDVADAPADRHAIRQAENLISDRMLWRKESDDAGKA